MNVDPGMRPENERRDPALLTRRHRTVGRVAAILEATASNPGTMRLGTLAELLDAPKSSVHGLVKGLVSVGYLTESGGVYSLGPALRTLLGSGEEPRLEDVAAPTMQRLRDEFDETVVLGHRMGDSIVYLGAAESRQLIKYVAPLQGRRPVLPTSMGKLYVADLTGTDLDSYVAGHVTDARARRELKAELAEVAETGVAVNRDGTVPGLCGVAAGIRRHGTLMACLSVVGPTDRLVPRLDHVSAAVKTAAAEIGANLP